MSDDSDRDISCQCGRDTGDGGVRRCDQCGQCHCSNKFCGGPQVVEIAGLNFLCTNCLDDKVLIDADKPDLESCCILCGREVYKWTDDIFILFDRTLCLKCLRETIHNIDT